MNTPLRILASIAATIGAFLLGLAGSFFIMLWWDSAVLHDHDGQAGISYLILSFFVGVACAVLVAILIAWRSWKRYSAPDSDPPPPQL